MTDAERLLSDPAALDRWTAERKRLADAATKGPWEFNTFTKYGGDPILTVQDVSATLAESARKSETAELWGVTVPSGEAIVAYTGNGPNSANNAAHAADARTALPSALEIIRLLRERVAGCPWCSEGERPTLDKVLADLAELPKLREIAAQAGKLPKS